MLEVVYSVMLKLMVDVGWLYLVVVVLDYDVLW